MIAMHHFTGNHGWGDFSASFLEVRDFLAGLEKDSYVILPFPWGRWEWMFSLEYLDGRFLDRIAIWKDDNVIVGLITYESNFGDAYYVLAPGYESLKPEVLGYARAEFVHEDKFRILIPDDDQEMQRLATFNGLHASKDKEAMSGFDADFPLDYSLPEGYSIVSLEDEYDLEKYNSVLWQGFNHGSDVPMDAKTLESRRKSLSGPDVVPGRNIAVRNTKGEFVSYCGTWYKDFTTSLLVEPVATIPAYRKLGLGKACVLEALSRGFRAGAKHALVGSDQAFYYRIGFYPVLACTWWQ